jgi:hypothetical protein
MPLRLDKRNSIVHMPTAAAKEKIQTAIPD